MNIKTNLHYIVYYKPSVERTFFNQKKILSKNFFFLLLLLEYFYKSLKFNSIKFSIKKKKKLLNSILRAPNRYKKAQIKMGNYFYILKITFCMFLPLNIKFFSKKKYYYILIIFYFLKKFLFFETSFLKLKKKHITFNIKDLSFLEKNENN